MRKHLSRLRKEGEVVLDFVDSAAAWEAVADAFFAHHSERQLGLGRAPSFTDPRKRRLYSGLFADGAPAGGAPAGGADGRGVATVLRVGGRAVAEHVWFEGKGVLHWAGSAFDPRDEPHSPGTVALALTLAEAERRGLRAVDFTLGIDPIKRRFGSECHLLRSVDLYPSAPPFYLRRARDLAARAAKQAIAAYGRLARPSA